MVVSSSLQATYTRITSCVLHCTHVIQAKSCISYYNINMNNIQKSYSIYIVQINMTLIPIYKIFDTTVHTSLYQYEVLHIIYCIKSQTQVITHRVLASKKKWFTPYANYTLLIIPYTLRCTSILIPNARRMHAFIHACMYVYVRVYTCACVCMSVCLSVCVHVYVRTYLRVQVCI